MVRTLAAASDERGSVRLLEVVGLPAARRGLVTIRDEERRAPVQERALLSGAALAHGWNWPEEEAAWSHFRPAPSFWITSRSPS